VVPPLKSEAILSFDRPARPSRFTILSHGFLSVVRFGTRPYFHKGFWLWSFGYFPYVRVIVEPLATWRHPPMALLLNLGARGATGHPGPMGCERNFCFLFLLWWNFDNFFLRAFFSLSTIWVAALLLLSTAITHCAIYSFSRPVRRLLS